MKQLKIAMTVPDAWTSDRVARLIRRGERAEREDLARANGLDELDDAPPALDPFAMMAQRTSHDDALLASIGDLPSPVLDLFYRNGHAVLSKIQDETERRRPLERAEQEQRRAAQLEARAAEEAERRAAAEAEEAEAQAAAMATALADPETGLEAAYRAIAPEPGP